MMDDQDKTSVYFAIEDEHEIPGRKEMAPEEDDDTRWKVRNSDTVS